MFRYSPSTMDRSSSGSKVFVSRLGFPATAPLINPLTTASHEYKASFWELIKSQVRCDAVKASKRSPICSRCNMSGSLAYRLIFRLCPTGIGTIHKSISTKPTVFRKFLRSRATSIFFFQFESSRILPTHCFIYRVWSDSGLLNPSCSKLV